MQNAGHAVAERALMIIIQREIVEPRVTVLVGPGNNGGDGLVAGRVIAQESAAQVRFYLLKPRGEDDPNFKAVQDAGLFVVNAEGDRDGRVLRNMVASAHIVIDALFGIGVKLPLRDTALKALRNVHKALAEPDESSAELRVIQPAYPEQAKSASAYILAVDCPSGLDCDTGKLDANAIPATETVTFIAAKPGLFTFPGAEAVGRLTVATIGVPEDAADLKDEKHMLVDAEMVRQMLPARPDNSHKGTFGKAFIAAGSVNFVGAPGLAAMAAYRVGTGLVTVGAPQPVVNALAGRLLEPTWVLLPHDLGVLAPASAVLIQKEAAGYDALLLGSGWGHEESTREMLVELFDRAGALTKEHHTIGFAAPRKIESNSENGEKALPPLVMDADGLNLLSKLDKWWTLLPENTILTPHPGEMSRLAGMDTEAVQADRWALAAAKAAEWKVILVLKGAHTLIAAPDGRIAVLPFKTAALATAGTGDVLAGMITGLLAQGMAPLEAAIAGAYLHGLAGECAAEQAGGTRSVAAGDVLAALPQAIHRVEGQ
jgi:ADP-dependent NAD(P)H-hydrate dehydratase / NAD(P)H-hydrate epimerase